MSERTDGALRWSACAVIVSAFLLRALSAITRVPGWEQDPTVIWIPDAGIAPFGSLLLDTLVWLAAGAVALRTRRLAWLAGLGVLVGTVGVLLHGLLLTPPVARGGTGLWGDFGSLVLGSAWAGAFVGAWALREAAREDAALQRALALVLLGAIAPWSAKGLYQVLVEHPQTVASFQRNREAWLLANGWEPGSTSARLFERRLLQAEASGWFGLANVYGSLVGACLVAWSVIAVNAAALARSRAIRPALALAPSLAALLAFVCLFASGSRGAIGAAAVVLLLLVAARFVRPVGAITRRLAPWMGWLLVGSILALVLVRAAFGERLGELSVYFRWQYLQGAVRVFAGHLPFGVGPDGFKDAYVLAKPPTSPEEVESPHMLPADWLATLGLFGVAWLAVWLGWIRQAGREAFRRPDTPPVPAPPTHPWSRPFALVCVAVPVLGALLVERAVTGPDWPLIMIVAGAAWLALVRLTAPVLSTAPDRALRIALAGAALALGMHAMFDVAPVHPHAAGWLMAVIALAAPARADETRVRGAVAPARVGIASACLAVVAALFVLGVLPAKQWGGLLTEASRLVREYPAPMPGQPEPPLVTRPFVAEALARLEGAVEAVPSQGVPADRSAAVLLRLAQEELALGNGVGARGYADRAVALLSRQTEVLPRSSARWARLAAAWEAVGALFDDREAFAAALAAWERTASLDPCSLAPARRAAELAAALGDADSASRWARRALGIDADLRLDPLRRLPDSQRAELERLASP